VKTISTYRCGAADARGVGRLIAAKSLFRADPHIRCNMEIGTGIMRTLR
jgi:hypothetical protein